MSSFKVGDKVKIISNNKEYTGEIVEDDGKLWSYFPDMGVYVGLEYCGLKHVSDR